MNKSTFLLLITFSSFCQAGYYSTSSQALSACNTDVSGAYSYGCGAGIYADCSCSIGPSGYFETSFSVYIFDIDDIVPTQVCNSGEQATYTFDTPDTIKICTGLCSNTSNVAGCVVSAQTSDCQRWVTAAGDRKTTCVGSFTGDTIPVGAVDDAFVDPDNLPPTSENDPCVDINGINFCDLPDSDKDCYSLNGVETCIGTVDGCGSIGGVVVCKDDPQNCGELFNEIVCITEQVPTINTTCMAFPETCASPPVEINNGTNSIWVTGKSGVKDTSTTNVITNNDGSTTTTTVNSTNVAGSGTTTSTTETSADGTSKTTVESDSKDGTGQHPIPSTDVDTSSSDTLIDTYFSDQTSSLSITEFSNSNFIDFLFPDLTSSCSSIPMNFNSSFASFATSIDLCSNLAPLRLIFGWFLYIVTAFTLVYIVVKPSSH